MEKRKLGRSGLAIAPLMFGGNVFGWTADEPMSFRLLDAFVDGGFNAIDTADVYSRWVTGHSGGESEAIIGRWLQQRKGRDRVVIATKVGMDMGGSAKGLSKAHIMASLEASLKRLQTGYIDLYQSHADDASVPIEETLGAYDALIKAGKVRAIGASNFTAPRLRQSIEASGRLSLARYESLQPEYNLYDRAAYEGPLEAACTEHGISVITYYSLAAGFLTGKYRTKADYAKSARGYRMDRYMNERGQRILAALDRQAELHRARPAQIALAWLIARPGVTAPIASATNPDQLVELMAAARLRLDQSSVAALDAASAA